MAKKKDGREIVTIGVGSASVLRGEDDVSTWDDLELAMGRRRDKNGHFTGKPPRLIPSACYAELKHRQVFDAESALGKRVASAAEYLADVAEGVEEPNAGRMRACEILLDRVVGKPTERITAKVDMSIENSPWAVALRNSIRGTRAEVIEATSTEVDDDIVDAELVEDDLCACGCGQPPKSGSLYFNASHEAHAKGKARRDEARPTPTEDDMAVWRRNQGAAPPPTTAQGTYSGTPTPEDDPTLDDDDDGFIEDTDDDPILWD